MKLRFIDRLYIGILLVIFSGIIFHAPLTVWLGTLAPGYELVIKSWKELLMLVAAPLAIMLVSHRRLRAELWRDWLFRAIIAFASLHLLLLALKWNGLNPSLAGLSIDLRWLLYFGLVYVAIRLYPATRRWFVGLGLAGALVVGVFALLQIFVLPRDVLAGIGYDKDTTIAPYLTVDRNPDYVRINSTLRGPNPLGAYAVIVLSLLLAVGLKESKRLSRYKLVTSLTIVGMTAALWASYSRSALIAVVASTAVVVASTVGRTLSRQVWITVVITVCGVLGGFIAASNSEFVSNVILHENPTGGSAVSSNDGHVSSLFDGWSRMIRQPLGAGIGSTGSASLYGDEPLIIENQYLFVAHETGWLGLAIFFVIFGLVLQRLWQHRSDYLALGLFASGVGMALIGLLLPIWTDDTVSIIWWGLAAVALGGSYGKKRPRY